MGKRNLNDPNIADIFRRLKRLETNTMLASASVGRGRLRFYDGSVLLIENGALNVTGTATIAGTLQVTGTTNLVGHTNISGPLNVTGVTSISGELGVTGPTNLDGVTTINGETTINGDTTITGLLNITGDTNITGLLDVSGNTTISADLELLTGGRFIAGETQIEPTGKATFGNFVIDPNSAKLIEAPGGYVISNGADQIGLSSASSSSVNLSSTGATLDYKGESTVSAVAGRINLSSVLTNIDGNLAVSGTITATGSALLNSGIRANALSSNTGAANLVRASNGYFYISSSASRFKLDIQEFDVPETLLEIEMVDWVDKGEAEAGEPYRRIPGVIAERVLEAGGQAFTTWDADGEIQGVDYDRLTLGITQILKRQVRELTHRVETLESSA
ncbi:hypothetical protein FQA45_00335 [Glutamicibacter halophytocola]|uniref:Peptidase S74 domain-containing protein n=1 Tax=Glutamicibacter halophytocola TaxID=1933880 RepID=A0ABX5Y500_9MICC|nr:hypothetical protein [Glutamicibacter halophytocola]QDY64882.1 hypothetical protein FQA45_00335 [Glutamicibacter halophytocola]